MTDEIKNLKIRLFRWALTYFTGVLLKYRHRRDGPVKIDAEMGGTQP